MTIPTVTPQDTTLFMQAQEIGACIRSFYTEDSANKGDKPWSNYSGYSMCPNPYGAQTKTGLLLETMGGHARRIISPFGYSQILGSTSGDGSPAIEKIKEFATLKLFQEGDDSISKPAYWSITEINGEPIGKATLRQGDERFSNEQAKFIWRQFRNGTLSPVTTES